MSHTEQWVHNGNAAHVGTKCMFTVECCGSDDKKRATYPERHDRAARIVKCWNNHDALVECAHRRLANIQLHSHGDPLKEIARKEEISELTALLEAIK